MKFSLTDHSFAVPSARMDWSRASWVQSAVSRAVSRSAVKVRVSSRVRFLGRKTSSVGGDGVAEEEAGGVAYLGKGLDAGLDEGCDLAEIGVGEDGGAEGFEELLGGELAEVFAVEPA